MALKVVLSREFAFGGGVDAADEGVVGLGVLAQFAAFGFLDRGAQGWAEVFISQVGQGGHPAALGRFL
jgi:hypothetical protein